MRPTRSIALFAAAIALPLTIPIVKPQDYPLYMFSPATPADAFDRFRLLAANALVIFSAAAGVLASLSLPVIGIRRRRWIYLLAPLVIVLHPLLQPVYFERLDTHLNFRWYARAKEGNVIGMTAAQVRTLLGEPTSQWTSRQEGYTAWEYQPLPFYWIGSRLQVFFDRQTGRVMSLDPNDD